jgi:phosphate transport system protein
MTAHTSKDFEQELRTLRERLATMGERAARQIALAMKALADKDDDLARDVIRNDTQIDRDENDIDELALQILATRQPVASDLRFITMALKFVVDLERIGDLAGGIAKRALELNRLPSLEPRVDLAKLSALVQKNLQAALDSFVSKDADRATSVITADAEIDKINASLFAELIGHRDPGAAADLGVSISREGRRSCQEPRRGGRLHGQGDRRPAPADHPAELMVLAARPDSGSVTVRSQTLRRCVTGAYYGASYVQDDRGLCPGGILLCWL